MELFTKLKLAIRLLPSHENIFPKYGIATIMEISCIHTKMCIESMIFKYNFY